MTGKSRPTGHPWMFNQLGRTPPPAWQLNHRTCKSMGCASGCTSKNVEVGQIPNNFKTHRWPPLVREIVGASASHTDESCNCDGCHLQTVSGKQLFASPAVRRQASLVHTATSSISRTLIIPSPPIRQPCGYCTDNWIPKSEA